MSRTQNGIFYTAGNPFNNPAFAAWAKIAKLPTSPVLEPFAGANSLIQKLENMGLCRQSDSFDLFPAAPSVQQRDTLADFPDGFSVCVTNPPWLAKNSATLRGLAFPDTFHDDLYKYALEKCLAHCGWVAALVPESFIRAGVFHARLSDFVSLTGKMFNDTDNPVGLALFGDHATQDVMVWRNNEQIGRLSVLENIMQADSDKVAIRFNAPDGNVGLIAVDNTIEPSIRFCDVSELENYEVKPSGRAITKLLIDAPVRLDAWNDCLNEFRQRTCDVLLTSFKGIRKDGKYRRRLDWATARGIINYAR